ncbi:MAG: LptF/LptG family permease [Holosporales bacterium]|nr:LptF/LptG family permease [Holosporales bacterium]
MLIQMTLLIVLSLTMTAWIGQSLRFAQFITRCGLSGLEFLMTSFYLFPDLILLTLPIGFALAVGIVYYRLKLSCQLVIAQSVGLSPAVLAHPIFALGTGIIILMYSINLYFAPLSMQHFKDIEAHLLQKIQILSAAEGGDVIDHEGIAIFAQQKGEDGTLFGIIMHDRRNTSTPRSIYAEHGRLVQHDTLPRLVLEQGQRVDFDVKTQHITTIHFDKYEADLSNISFLAQERTRKPCERFLKELLFPPELKTNPRFAQQLQAEGHQRLVSPFFALIFALISFLSVFKTEGQRYVSAKSFCWTALLIITIECTNLGFLNLASKYPFLSFANYGMAGSIFMILITQFFKRRP